MTFSHAARRTFTDAEVAVTAAQAGADVIRSAYGTGQHRISKSSTEFATETDLASEKAILAVLAEHRPRDARQGEESGLSGDSTAGCRAGCSTPEDAHNDRATPVVSRRG